MQAQLANSRAIMPQRDIRAHEDMLRRQRQAIQDLEARMEHYYPTNAGEEQHRLRQLPVDTARQPTQSSQTDQRHQGHGDGGSTNGHRRI